MATTGNGLYIESIWSKAGCATTIHVRGIDKAVNLLFDCGMVLEDSLYARYVFITHGHIDHSGACLSHARAKSLGQKSTKYYVPPGCVKPLLDARKAFEALDGSTIKFYPEPMDFMTPVTINRNYSVFAFPTTHRVPSQGYAIIYKKIGELLPAFQQCSKEELIQYNKQGVNMRHVESKVVFCYTGDTTMAGLLEPGLDFVFTCELLIIELTYLEGDRSSAEKYGHIHLDDILEHMERFQNKSIVFVHLSARYSTSTALEILRAKIPVRYQERFYVALRCFGSFDQITPILPREKRSRRSFSSQSPEEVAEVQDIAVSFCVPCKQDDVKDNV